MTRISSKQASPRQRRRPSAVTIHDVAARAGVSVATVSRVINRKALVREETSRHVLAVAQSMKYVPNVAARSLSIRRSHTIGVVLPDVHGDFFSEVIRGIDSAARKASFHILVSGSHSDRNEMLEVLDAMHGRVDALIVMAPDVSIAALNEQLPSNLPLVLLNSTAADRDTLTIDNYGGAAAMMAHLYALGHRRIAFIKGPHANADARERLRGYRTFARRDASMQTRELEGDFTEHSGYDAVRSALGAGRMPQAIFAANDSMAVGAMSALAEAGLTVPGDVAISGFDDIPIARFVAPPLTTIRVDIEELGRRAFETVFLAIDQPVRRRPVRERLPTSLIVRKSCGAHIHQSNPVERQQIRRRNA
ncbi:MAG: LacI family DNA-binding transcriptional regulator [Thermoanaerobaculia bacterium]